MDSTKLLSSHSSVPLYPDNLLEQLPFFSKGANLKARRSLMPDEYVEIAEICDKVIQRVRIFESTPQGTEMEIDLTDGTSFSCSFCFKPAFEARLMRKDGNMPVILQTYQLE